VIEDGAAAPWLPAAAHGPHDLAIDLGTAYVRVFARGRGLVADEPSLVRVWRSPLALESVGARAQAPHDDDHATFPVQPLSKGVLRDGESAAWLLTALVRRAWGLSLVPPRVLACAPTDATAEEIESLRDALRRAGASTITVVPEPLAAAAGVGLDPTSPHAQILVDAGEGVTDVAVIRQGRIEASRALRVGCFDLRSAVADFLVVSHGFLAPADAIEDLIHRADASDPDVATLSLETDDAPDGVAGGKRTATVERAALLEVMASTLDRIAGVVRAAWEALPEETRAEVRANGLWLTGGGARLRLLVERVREATSVEPRVPANPLHAVITGASRMAFSGG
jgi:rod shape-determining protein MreB